MPGPASPTAPLAPLRVLLVCEDIPGAALGGLARHVVALGNALLDAGHAVRLMGRIPPSLAMHAEETGFRGPFIAGFTDPFRGWKEQATGAYNPWKRPYFARRIAQAIQAHAADFDVVHYHGHLPMVARYVPPHIHFVQTRHDQGSECITHVRFRSGKVCTATDARTCATCIHPAPGPLRTAISVAAVRRYRRETAQAFAAHPVVFVSKFLLNNYRRAVPDSPGLRAHVVHNFVDETALQAVAALRPVAAVGEVVLHVAGRLDSTKGIAAFVDILAPRMPAHWRIRVCGDGPDRAGLAMRHSADRVVLLGHVTARETLQGAAAATVCVVPSMLEEAFGLVTLEALRLGKPCYALRRGGTPELAQYGAPGQLRLFDDLQTLVDGLLADVGGPPQAVGGVSADVQARLPALLALYRGGSEPSAD